MIELSEAPTDEELLAAVRAWLMLLAAGDYVGAHRALQFRSGWGDPESLRQNIETFFGTPSKPIAPSDDVMRRAEVYRGGIGHDRYLDHRDRAARVPGVRDLSRVTPPSPHG